MIGKLPININDLLRQRTIEGERIEYKAGWNPVAVLHTICAFANDFHNLGGGYVVLGVEEHNGRPLLPPRGLDPERVDAVQRELLELGHSAMQPHYHPITADYTVEGRTILVLWVPGGETRPYKARVDLAKGGAQWAWYIRKHSSTVRARGADERELLGLAATVPFDDRYHQTASLDDLSLPLIERFLRDVGSDLAPVTLPMEALGRRMNIVGGPSEASFPKNVGLLFFNEAPHRFFPATQIDVVWFPDGAGGDRFEEKEFRGPLSVILRDAIGFIGRNYLKETVVKHPQRPEAERFWNFPIGAIEEALVNAIYHRSYEEREPVEVRITTEELAVLSFPGADRSIRMEDLRAGRAVSRRYRNRRIGEFLKELDLAEGRSTGIPKILRAMRDNGSPAPIFQSDEDRTWFLVRLPMHVAHQVTQQVTQQATPQVTQLLAVLTGEMSRTDLQAALKLRDRNYLADAYLKPALETGLIEMTLPNKPNSPNQRYRRTGSWHVAPQDVLQVTHHVTTQVMQLLAVLTGEMSRAELQAALRLRDRHHFTAVYLQPALEAGLIEMTIPGKPTSRNQRYRRTAVVEALAPEIKRMDPSA